MVQVGWIWPLRLEFVEVGYKTNDPSLLHEKCHWNLPSTPFPHDTSETSRLSPTVSTIDQEQTFNIIYMEFDY